MSRKLLDLDRPLLWPLDLLGYLNEQHDLFRRWETGQGQVSGDAFDKAANGLRVTLQPYHILGWHCTRLTDAETEEIRRNGMQLPNAEMLALRIDALVKTGHITPDIGQHLRSNNQADQKNRAGKVWFCFFPPRKSDEWGIGRFFRHWGGEALYVCHESDPLTSPVISCIGTPRIVEADVPIKLLRRQGNLERSIYQRYLIHRGVSIMPPTNYEDLIVHPLPAKNVRRVISFPDADFYSLTGCPEWCRPLRNVRLDPAGT